MTWKILHIGKKLSQVRCWRGDLRTLGKLCSFSPLLSLETVFPALKVTQNCYLNVNISFFENWPFNHILGPLRFSTNILCLKNYPHNLTKYEINRPSKIPISHFFTEFRKIWNCNLGDHP